MAVGLSLGGSALTAPSITRTDEPRDGYTLVSGQQAGAVTMLDESGHADAEPADQGGLPVFDTAHAALTHLIRVPYWFRPWHLAVIAAATPTAAIGLALIWTGRSAD